MSVTSLVPAIAADQDAVVPAVFEVACQAPGEHEVVLRAAPVRFLDIHVRDPDPANDAMAVTTEAECVVPVALNIRPGNDDNGVQPSATQRLPVAVLTTAAGEYGLPLAFDATSIDGVTAQFGTPEVLQGVGGSGAQPSKGATRDAHEPDDAAKDGDKDRVFNFDVPGSGIGSDTSEACVAGWYDAPGGPFAFLGCYVVQAIP